MKKYIEKYGEQLIRQLLKQKADYGRKEIKIKNYFCVTKCKEKNRKTFYFQYSTPFNKEWCSVSVYIIKTGTKYTVSDFGYSAATYMRNTNSVLNLVPTSSYKDVSSNNLVKTIKECALRSYEISVKGK